MHRQLRGGSSIGLSEIGERLTAEVLLGWFYKEATRREKGVVISRVVGFRKRVSKGVSAGLQKRGSNVCSG